MKTDFSNDEGESIEKIIKIIVVGKNAAGKTAIIRQYCQGAFTEFYKSTIGVDFSYKTIELDSKTVITVQLWDISGQEMYGNISHIYYKESSGGLVVFDVTDQSSFDVVEKWKLDIDEKVFTSEKKPIPCILLGNKIDLRNDELTEEKKIEMDNFAKEHNFIGYYETSAKFGTNISETIKALVKYIIDNNIEPYSDSQENTVELDNNYENEEGNYRGCC